MKPTAIAWIWLLAAMLFTTPAAAQELDPPDVAAAASRAARTA